MPQDAARIAIVVIELGGRLSPLFCKGCVLSACEKDNRLQVGLDWPRSTFERCPAVIPRYMSEHYLVGSRSSRSSRIARPSATFGFSPRAIGRNIPTVL